MIDTELKEKVIAEFSHFVENYTEETLNIPYTSIDLYALFKEFISLKTEIKHESRQFKAALDGFREVFTTLERNSETLSNELAERRMEEASEIERQQHKTLKPLLLEFLELRDAIEAGVISSGTYYPHFLSTLFKREKALIMSMHEGQSMTLRRLDQLLSNYNVHHMKVVHQPFDARMMRAVAIVTCQSLSDGIVTAEVRKGYKWNNELLRLAEVKVNKIEENNNA